MRSRRVLLALAVSSLLSATLAAPNVFVAYPEAGHRVAYGHVILEGSVTPGAALTVDGQPVNVGADGLFMEWWPLRPGTNDLRLVARQGGQSGVTTLKVIRTVSSAIPARPSAIDAASVQPREVREFWDPAGDSPAERSIELSFQGSPGGRAAYRLGQTAPAPMREGPAGTYRATFVVPTGAQFRQAIFTFTLTGKDGKTVTAVAPGRLSTGGGVRLGMQNAGSVLGLGLNQSTFTVTDLAGAALLYPRDGMTFALVGRQGEDVRARLAPGQSALITAEQLELAPGAVALAAGGAITLDDSSMPELPAGPVLAESPQDLPTLPPGGPLPVAAPPVLAVPKRGPGAALPVPAAGLRLRLPLGGARLPFRLEQEEGGKRLVVTLYGSLAQPLTGPEGGDPLLGGVEIRPLALGVTRVALNLNAAQAWGFTANYDGPDLVVTVRRPPTLDPARPLEGRTITLDPGHGGSQNGGAGSLRVPEKGLVLPIALRAAELLRGLGATVTLTRSADLTLGLYERGLMAEASASDLLVSIHANALPDGRDPRGVRGPEVYFTHPQAAALAGSILGQLRARLPELGPGAGLKPGTDLALTRPTTQISLLVETAYLTDAGNLRTLSSPEGRERFAGAIATGIAEFYAAQVER
ncbi:N-acetylmuramoyl-L-alanine amidase family protein [Deinococcus radiopugnans]|uniref:N-acetylmuramoyl-L-alanine amidase n=1 Tax=Deinococcus radiopugnans ATCC 19172 TaxID=585398 RepID=A0A5C4Y1U4_9DEIO|nr:N-acetylmuramoyl-L-alanine amidase [Deinococcus radiopugnans]MBB6017879.1 N-acetylmuramoyl-L-alanine amidase [Deinococcus radiopugnans ATCC 19172]TNM68942.1 N-acetylmuramoyl-L-alanine amidase [Deinococcus radiopugnans ATCC 19172]